MQDKYKTYAKLNIVSLFFIALSFMSITLAWFAYSGLTDVSTEIGVKAWYIEFDKKTESNNVVITLDDVYPGMETKSERVKISNLGDSDAQISYTVLAARLLDENLEQTITNSDELEDALAHNYPFHININLDKGYAKEHGGESEFIVSVSWPLDSNQDSLDSEWGSKSYNYLEQQAKLPEEERESQIKIVISLKAEQYIGDNNSSDPLYNLGDTILIDKTNGKKCTTLSDNCIKTYVIDVDNKLGDEEATVTLLPDLYQSYDNDIYANYDTTLSNITGTWGVVTRPLVISDLLKVISTDIIDSVLVRENLSDKVIGNLNYGNRLETELNKVIASDENHKFLNYRFLNERFPFLVSSKCYWINTEYDSDNVFALSKIDDTYSKIYKVSKSKEDGCEIVPVIIALKRTLEEE